MAIQNATNSGSKVRGVVNAGTILTLKNLKIQVPTTNQVEGFLIAGVNAATVTICGTTNYNSGGTSGTLYSNNVPSYNLGTAFANPFGYSGSSPGHYTWFLMLSGQDMYKGEIYLGLGFSNNFVSLELL